MKPTPWSRGNTCASPRLVARVTWRGLPSKLCLLGNPDAGRRSAMRLSRGKLRSWLSSNRTRHLAASQPAVAVTDAPCASANRSYNQAVLRPLRQHEPDGCFLLEDVFGNDVVDVTTCVAVNDHKPGRAGARALRGVLRDDVLDARYPAVRAFRFGLHWSSRLWFISSAGDSPAGRPTTTAGTPATVTCGGTS